MPKRGILNAKKEAFKTPIFWHLKCLNWRVPALMPLGNLGVLPNSYSRFSTRMILTRLPPMSTSYH